MDIIDSQADFYPLDIKRRDFVKMAENRSNSDQYLLRFPPGMREHLKATAEKNNRSMNAEIVARLEDSFRTSIVLPSHLLRTLEVYSSRKGIPLNRMVEDALEAAFPYTLGLGDFIERWAYRATASWTQSQRDEILAEANSDPSSEITGLSLKEEISDEGESMILVLSKSSKSGKFVTLAMLPAEKVVG